MKNQNNLSVYNTSFSINERCKQIDVYAKSFQKNNFETKFNASHFKNIEFLENGWLKKSFPLELAKQIRKSITALIYQKIKEVNNDFKLTESDFILGNYHQLVNNDQHNKIINAFRGRYNFFSSGGIPLSKLGVPFRFLDEFVNNALETTVNFSCFKTKFNIFKFDKFWIRIIRPNTNDNNPPHKDSHLPRLKCLVNAYMPICGSNEMSSLPIISKTHIEQSGESIVSDSPCFILNKKNTVPCIVYRNSGLNMFTPNPSESEILLFSSHLIHGGGVNDNKDITRISLEMRFSPKMEV